MSPGRLKPTICCCGGKSVTGLVLKRRPSARDLVGILVRRSIVGQLGGEVDYIWKPEGFSAFISIPMERLSS